MQKEEIINRTTGIIRKHLPEQYKIFLFGSWVKGKARYNSDIDIGILGKEKIKWAILSKIIDAVDELDTLRSIDIVDLNRVDVHFRKNVIQQGRII